MSVVRPLLGCVLLTAALTAGCFGGGSSDVGSPAPVDTSQCDQTFVYAPAAYVIHVASGDAVILDPLANDFPVFCDPESAKTAMGKAQASGKIPQGEWRIFRVYGSWSELATETDPGVFLLNRAAPLVDWVE